MNNKDLSLNIDIIGILVGLFLLFGGQYEILAYYTLGYLIAKSISIWGKNIILSRKLVAQKK